MSTESQLQTEDKPRIDSFMVADWAEAINGKLYVMGAGFDTVFAPQFPWPVRFSIGAILVVPWKDTNRRFPIQGLVETSDGEELDWKLAGEVEAGRAAGKRGGDVRIVVAGPVAFQVEEPLNFVLKLRFASDERSLALQITPPPFPGVQMPGQPPVG